MPVHALDDRAVQVQDVHVEGEVDDAEVEERAGDDPPPLALGDQEAVDEVLLPDRANAAPEHATAKGLAVAQDRVDREQRRADRDDRVGHPWRVGGVRTARAVELAPSCEVVAGLLQQPRDAVRDLAALRSRRTPIRLAIGGDRSLEVAVTHELLGDTAPSQPRAGSLGVGRLLPCRERSRLVVGAVAGGADRHPRVAGQRRVGMTGQRRQDGDRPGEVAGVEEPAALVEPEGRFVRHVRGLWQT